MRGYGIDVDLCLVFVGFHSMTAARYRRSRKGRFLTALSAMYGEKTLHAPLRSVTPVAERADLARFSVSSPESLACHLGLC